jgi:hypothetical protein
VIQISSLRIGRGEGTRSVSTTQEEGMPSSSKAEWIRGGSGTSECTKQRKKFSINEGKEKNELKKKYRTSCSKLIN